MFGKNQTECWGVYSCLPPGEVKWIQEQKIKLLNCVLFFFSKLAVCMLIFNLQERENEYTQLATRGGERDSTRATFWFLGGKIKVCVSVWGPFSCTGGWKIKSNGSHEMAREGNVRYYFQTFVLTFLLSVHKNEIRLRRRVLGEMLPDSQNQKNDRFPKES